MRRLACSLLLLVSAIACGDEVAEVRDLLAALALDKATDEEAALAQLSEYGNPFIGEFVESWRVGDVLSYTAEDGEEVVLQRVGESFRSMSTGEIIQLSADRQEELTKLRPSRSLRRELKKVTDTIDLSSPDARTRMDAALKLGGSQNPDYLPALRARLAKEEYGRTRRVVEEALMISLLENFATPEERVAAVKRLGQLHSVPGRDLIQRIHDDPDLQSDQALHAAAGKALRRIESRMEFVRHAGSFFRGLSTGSVLLMVAFGLAITFGLMGIINMAHGEFIAIGGYTCYVVQTSMSGIFGPNSGAFQLAFWLSLPFCFLVAGIIGLAFEKGFIRFLYRRPLESLLATWGLSMIMRQGFRLIFGAANVQVNTPQILYGNFEYGGISMTYARLFVILFAGVVVTMTWALFAKTSLGLYIRAVMQNRTMASSLGIPVSRVNAFTFAYGCALASLAGAALSQIGNVGPSMGQAYIVDSFMVVVAGGIGNLLGAGISAMGIGVVDQLLQPILGPVMGKIIVLFAIILFLQWKPGGLFPTKTRSLDD